MRFSTTILLLILMMGCLYAQVSNVRVQQRTDGNLMVDIYYDFSNPNGYDTKIIGIEASNDNGTTWDLECASITGDVGEDITAGTDYHIVWDFYADNPNTSGSQFKVRVLYSFFSTMTGNDSKVYKTVKIGNQWWMAENLRETKYNDGTAIIVETDNDAWIYNVQINKGKRCAFKNIENYANMYGYLYNWWAVDPNNSYNIAPTGWHVPTDAEWATLVNYLGGEDVAGGKLRNMGLTYWMWPNTGATNESGFNALPGGYRNSDAGNFEDQYSNAWFWSSSGYTNSTAWSQQLFYNSKSVIRNWSDKGSGYSVRLVKD